MHRAKATRILGLLVATSLIATSCTLPPPPTPEDILDMLSYAVLVPERTCAELREEFGVEHLPLVDYPDELGLEFEEDFVQTTRGESLRVWYIPAESERGVVVISPGAVGSMPCYLFVALLLHEQGWSAVMYEYQGFGQSTGIPNLDSLRPDLAAVLDWTQARTGAEEVSLFGLSLGSIPSVALAVERPDTVNAVVLDSPVALREELQRFDFFLAGQSELVIRLLDPSLITEELIDRMQQPLLVFLHEEDYVTPPAAVELLFELAPGPKELVRFTGLEHAQAQFFDTEVYVEHMDSFLSEVWESEVAAE
ncbi:MAG: alpha/beta fold hydrolase [Phycisphaerae bacterium]|nr:alpha/beta fold hydrolase [Phycisphaerae bacterium]